MKYMAPRIATFAFVSVLCLSLIGCGNSASTQNAEQNTPVDTQSVGSDTVTTGDQVSILYEGRTDDGELFDTNIVTIAQEE